MVKTYSKLSEGCTECVDRSRGGQVDGGQYPGVLQAMYTFVQARWCEVFVSFLTLLVSSRAGSLILAEEVACLKGQMPTAWLSNPLASRNSCLDRV